MRTRSLFTVVLAVLLSTACARTPQSGDVTRVTVGDTLFVSTTLPVEEPAPLHTMEQDLVIGTAEGSEEYLLRGVSSVTADQDGNIYITNQQDGEVRVYDPEGVFVRRFGRRGGGPGVFNSNYWGWFRAEVRGNHITVEDLPHLRVFDREGGFERSIDLQCLGRAHGGSGMPFAPVHWLPERERLVLPLRISGPDRPTTIVLALTDEGFEDPVWLPPMVEPSSFYREGTRDVALPFFPDFAWALSGDRIVAWGLGDRFRITLFDLQSSLWTVAELDIQPQPVTSAEIQRYKDQFLERRSRFSSGGDDVWAGMLDRAEYPAYKPVFEELIGDGDGRIWVEMTQRPDPADPGAGSPYRYRIIEADGTHAGYVDSPVQILYLRDGLAYAYGSEEYPTIVRWRLTDTGGE